MAHHTDEELVQCWQWLVQLHTSAKAYRDMHAESAWRQADAGKKLDAELEEVDVLLRRMRALRQDRIAQAEAEKAARERKC